jgi:hypothetical protein
MMGVPVNTAGGFMPGVPHLLFTGSIARRFVVMPDGKFIGFGQEPDPFVPAYVVLNWGEELKRRIPPAR